MTVYSADTYVIDVDGLSWLYGCSSFLCSFMYIHSLCSPHLSTFRRCFTVTIDRWESFFGYFFGQRKLFYIIFKLIDEFILYLLQTWLVYHTHSYKINSAKQTLLWSFIVNWNHFLAKLIHNMTIHFYIIM